MKNANEWERRCSGRFPIQSEIFYRVLEGKHKLIAGKGITLDISSAGILFTTEQPIHEGKRVELSVDWPARLDGNCRLKLVALGRVVRSEGATAAIAIEKYEFRTQGSNGLNPAPKQAAASLP